MATTTNYGWDTPDDTDLVKDGAAAIRELGQDIDTNLFSITGGKNVGMQLLAFQTLSGASAAQINNVFSSAFTSYRIVMDLVSSGNNYLNGRLSTSGTPLSTATYQYGSRYWDSAGGTGTAEASSGQAQWIIGYATTVGSQAIMDITYSGIARPTIFTGMSVQGSTAVIRTGQNSNSTAYDGFNVFGTGGITLTGTVSVYGYRNS